jgi:UDP-N-acetylglucosamine 2-epimerase (non-hydrolysing)
MSRIFFEDLELPKPDFYLGIGSGSHAEQTGKIMIEFEKILLKEKPDLVIVVGDVNSTIACSLTASKLHIKSAHVEAGLRSFDRQMPEEINRLLTDQISDFLFVTEASGLVNLKREGIQDHKIFFSGNVMIDSLTFYLEKAKKSSLINHFGIEPHHYVLITLHRPSNVDSETQLQKITTLLNSIARKRKLLFPVHPRTKRNLEMFNLLSQLNENIILSEPIGYLDFLNLLHNAELVITDSGGIQEETTYLGVQCITLRTSTERPITVEIGTNHLVGEDFQKAEMSAEQVLSGKIKTGKIPDFWDGKTANRITEIIMSKL